MQPLFVKSPVPIRPRDGTQGLETFHQSGGFLPSFLLSHRCGVFFSHSVPRKNSYCKSHSRKSPFPGMFSELCRNNFTKIAQDFYPRPQDKMRATSVLCMNAFMQPNPEAIKMLQLARKPSLLWNQRNHAVHPCEYRRSIVEERRLGRGHDPRKPEHYQHPIEAYDETVILPYPVHHGV